VRRLKLLRVVLPLLLVAFVVALGLAIRSRPPRGVAPAGATQEEGARMEGFRFSDLVGDTRRLLVEARLGRIDEQGGFTLDDVRRVEVDRQGQTPLVLSAARGKGSGAQGKRVVRLEGGVTIHDDDLGATLVIPTVEIDQPAGVVRSVGDVRVEGDRAKGTASAIVYSLRGEPAQIFTLALDGKDGSHVDAHHVTVEPGSKTAVFEGDVHARQGEIELAAERMVAVRNAAGRIESVEASPSVTGRAPDVAGGAGGFAAHEMRAAWGAGGRLSTLALAGDVRVEQTRGMLTADRVDVRAADAGIYRLDASGSVVVSGALRDGNGRLACDALSGELHAHGEVENGTATGNVRFDGNGTAGEAARMEFSSLDATGKATLHAEEERRARLANGRTRIAADTIVSDLRGIHLTADGHVESTLLPAQGGPSAVPTPPMFVPGAAVHFVSGSLESFDAGKRLDFRGDVRGWQGDRALTADSVEMQQDGELLVAHGHVTTRMPRASGNAASDADYLQITAERLTYRGTAHTAEYDGTVRVRQSEGWLEAPHLTAILRERGGGLLEAKADGGVRFEYRAPGAQGIPTTVTGEGDRLTYETDARLVRIFGDKAPATVRGTGANQGTTVGRVLRYQLDTGGLEVESGERDRATIKTPKS
jgi:lipopolysaccharide export system protein LptA